MTTQRQPDGPRPAGRAPTQAVPDGSAPAGAAPVGSAPGSWLRRPGALLAIAAVVLLAINLRPAVNALGAVMPELRAATGLSGTVSGVLLALPTLCFALVGLITPATAARIGPHRTVVLALVALTAGQVLRAVAPGTWALFPGSILALAGIAVGNVLLPGLVRLHFPTAITPMTAVYTTVLMVGQTLGAGITLPLQHGLGGSWRTGIGMWAATAAVALVPWVAAVVQQTRAPAGGSAGAARRIGVLGLVRSRRAWAMAVFFGGQSLQAYVIFGWLPSILADAGLSDEAAAAAVAIVTAVDIPISAVVPALLGRLRRPGALVVVLVICFALGYVGLIVTPTSAPWLLAILIGLGCGSFPTALTLMALRSQTPAGTNALSAFSQSAGYLMASIGPIGFGFLHDLSGGWTLPLVALICTLVPVLVSGFVATRRWHIEGELDRLPTDGGAPAGGR